jgi:hypothetical protein
MVYLFQEKATTGIYYGWCKREMNGRNFMIRSLPNRIVNGMNGEIILSKNVSDLCVEEGVRPVKLDDDCCANAEMSHPKTPGKPDTSTASLAIRPRLALNARTGGAANSPPPAMLAKRPNSCSLVRHNKGTLPLHYRYVPR